MGTNIWIIGVWKRRQKSLLRETMKKRPSKPREEYKYPGTRKSKVNHGI
jgi:hypothetical protein